MGDRTVAAILLYFRTATALLLMVLAFVQSGWFAIQFANGGTPQWLGLSVPLALLFAAAFILWRSRRPDVAQKGFMGLRGWLGLLIPAAAIAVLAFLPRIAPADVWIGLYGVSVLVAALAAVFLFLRGNWRNQHGS